MTVNQAIDWADSIRPNNLDRDIKIGFLNEIESIVQTDIFHRDPVDAVLWNMESIGDEYVSETNTEKAGDFAVVTARMVATGGTSDGFVLYDETSGNATLLVPDPYSRLYKWYIAAMISASGGNDEVFKYDLSLYQKAQAEYSAYYVRKHGR